MALPTSPFSGMLGAFQSGNQAIAQGLEAANVAKAKQAIAGAAGPVTTQQVQQLGGQTRAASGQAQLGVAEQGVKQAAQVGQLGLQQQGMEMQKQLADKQLALQQKRRQFENELAKMSEDVKNKVLDANLQFRTDELGRTQWNERQLMDFAIRKAKDRNSFEQYKQQAQQLSTRKIQLYKTAYAKLNQRLEQDSRNEIRELDQAAQERLIRAREALKRKLQDAQNEAANRSAMWGAGGAVLGGVVGGAVTGTPQGASAGASAGGALGTGAQAATGGMKF